MDSRYMAEGAADSRSLEKLLVPALAGTLSAGRGQERDGGLLQILDLACGSCRELESVTSALRRASSRPRQSIRFVGADIRGAHLDEARERARMMASPQFEAEFILEDCARLERHADTGREFDLVFLRHQNFWNDPRAWRKIFTAGLERLNEAGVMIITSYFDREHQLAVNTIEEAGGELVTSVRNPDSRRLGTAGKSVDRHLAVFRRQTNAAQLFCPVR